MLKERHPGIYLLGSCTGIGLLLFIYNDFFCKSEKCYWNEVTIIEPTFYLIVGLLPTLILLLFFSKAIFSSWAKHIAWWFAIGTVYFVANTNPYSSSVLTIDRAQVALFWMAVLFIVTLVYALIMNMKLKNSHG